MVVVAALHLSRLLVSLSARQLKTKHYIMRNSKSILFLVIVCSLIFLMSSCKNNPLAKLGQKLSDSEMSQLVETLNEQCPVSYEIGTATSFKCEGKKVVIDYTIDEDILSFEKLDKKVIFDAWRLLYLDCCSSNDKAFMKSLALSGYDLQCFFTGSRTSHKDTIDVSNQQLKSIKPLSQEENIKTTVEITRAVLPIPLDSVTDMVDVTLEKESLIYIYKINEENFDFSLLENEPTFRENIASGITQQFTNNNSAGELFKKLCLSGRGLCYRYQGSKTGRTIDIEFNNIQLRQLANNGGAD